MDLTGVPDWAITESLRNMTTSDIDEDNTPRCPKCKGTESLFFNAIGKPDGCLNCTLKGNAQAFNKNPEKYLTEIGIPIRYLNCSFENFKVNNSEVEKVYLNCKKIDRDFKSSLFLHSNRPGTGKTHLSVAIIRKLCENGVKHKPVFISSPFLFLEIKSTFNSEKEDSEKKIIEKYSTCDFLFVDDIGVEKCSDWANQIWYMIIDSRYSAMKPTIYTSNLSIGDIAAKIDPRIASRLASGMVCNIDTNDYRLTKQLNLVNG